MSKKADANIGRRAFEFFNMQPDGVTEACKKFNISRGNIYGWASGVRTPSAYHLQKLCLLGADINYILTGRRSINNDK